ncbi:MAG: GNAT family N-acetyltransferase [Chitinophagaceae bacterium]
MYFFAGIYPKNKQDELIGFITNKEAGLDDRLFLGGLNYELSYALRKDFRGKGIMIEVIISTTNFMRIKTVNIVAALVKPGNIQAEKTLHKAGFDIAMMTPVELPSLKD